MSQNRLGGQSAGAAVSSGDFSVEVLQEFVCCELDLLMPPLRGTVATGDQPHPVQTAKVATRLNPRTEGASCLRGE